MRRILPLLIAIAIIVSAGLVHGRWTNRWRRSHDLDRAISRLALVPTTIGDWQGRDLELDRTQLEEGEIDGYLSREYVNRRTGQAVSVLIVCGRPGPISEHTPDVCYSGAGYTLMADPALFEMPAEPPRRPNTFRVGMFLKSKATGRQALRIYWAWKSENTWEAPTNPRFTFAMHPALYKLYVIHDMNSPDGRISDDPATSFLQSALLPELERALREGA